MSAPDRVRAPEASVRPAMEADLPAAFAITWRCDRGVESTVPADPDRLRYLRHSLTTGRMTVAEADGRIVGFGAVVVRGGVTIVADLFVDPPWHGRGVGARVLDDVLGAAWPRQTFSSAHPNALPLYVRAGMVPRWPSLYVHGDPSVMAGADPPTVTAAAGAEHAELAEAERAWSGVDRAQDHAYWAGASRALSVVIERAGRPFGYAYLAAEAHEDPEWWVSSMSVAPNAGASDTVGALRAVFALAVDHGISSLGLAVPGPHPATVPLLRSGWRIVDRDVYVSNEPGLLDPERRIPDPTFG